MVNLESILDMPEKEAVQYIHDLYMKGASSTDLAKALDCTGVTICNFFRKYKLPLKTQGGHYLGKHIYISEEDYLKYTYRELAMKYKISAFSVYQATKMYPPKLRPRGTGKPRGPKKKKQTQASLLFGSIVLPGTE